MSQLSVIIPSRNVGNLSPCVKAVLTYEPKATIFVIDDGLLFKGTPFGSDPRVILIPGLKPFVFARNVNLGLYRVFKYCQHFDATVILNDDALLQTRGGFSLLQKAAEEFPEYGLIASTTNNVGNRNQWPAGIGFRDEPRMVCFVAVLVARRTLETVGLLDERFVGYGMDDDDYSLRVRKAGLKIGIHDGCYVDHASLTSSYRGPVGAGGNFLPNMKLFIEKWGVDNWGKDRAHSEFASLFPEVLV